MPPDDAINHGGRSPPYERPFPMISPSSTLNPKTPTITLTRPAETGSRGQAVVIGSGFGGIAAAIRLQA